LLLQHALTGPEHGQLGWLMSVHADTHFSPKIILPLDSY
jgi:hypothetical protein